MAKPTATMPSELRQDLCSTAQRLFISPSTASTRRGPAEGWDQMERFRAQTSAAWPRPLTRLVRCASLTRQHQDRGAPASNHQFSNAFVWRPALSLHRDFMRARPESVAGLRMGTQVKIECVEVPAGPSERGRGTTCGLHVLHTHPTS